MGNLLYEQNRELTAVVEQLKQERDIARSYARVLAHAYENDTRPPQAIVEAALGFPVFEAALYEPSLSKATTR
jgi:hypothetical protein